MTVLSRTPLNPLRSGTQELVGNAQKMHALVRGVIPPSATGRVLWRLEELGHHYDLYVQSPEVPSLEHFVEKAGWPGPSGVPQVANLEPLLRQIAVAREFSFRVTLNPVTSTRSPLKPTASQIHTLEAGSRAVRVGHRTAYYQMEWFVGRTSGENLVWGFELLSGANGPDARIASRRRLRFRKPAGGPPITLETATYEGRLRVTNPERFTHSLVNGIGKGKAYGCGLLTLAAG